MANDNGEDEDNCDDNDYITAPSHSALPQRSRKTRKRLLTRGFPLHSVQCLGTTLEGTRCKFTNTSDSEKAAPLRCATCLPVHEAVTVVAGCLFKFPSQQALSFERIMNHLCLSLLCPSATLSHYFCRHGSLYCLYHQPKVDVVRCQGLRHDGERCKVDSDMPFENAEPLRAGSSYCKVHQISLPYDEDGVTESGDAADADTAADADAVAADADAVAADADAVAVAADADAVAADTVGDDNAVSSTGGGIMIDRDGVMSAASQPGPRSQALSYPTTTDLDRPSQIGFELPRASQ